MSSYAQTSTKPTIPKKGRVYEDPEDGLIFVTGGSYISDGDISNHFDWIVLATGERKNGYSSGWQEVSYEIDVTRTFAVDGEQFQLRDSIKFEVKE